MKTIMLLGQKSEIIDADNLRSAIFRLQTNLELYIAGETGKLPKSETDIKGYALAGKFAEMAATSPQALKLAHFANFASEVEAFMEPFTRAKDPIGNINQALTDLMNLSLQKGYSGKKLELVMDVCAKKYEHQASRLGVENPEAKTAMMKLIDGLLRVFEKTSEVVGNTPQQRLEREGHFAEFVKKVCGMVVDAAGGSAGTVVSVDFANGGERKISQP